jgi:hypothetical protein
MYLPETSLLCDLSRGKKGMPYNVPISTPTNLISGYGTRVQATTDVTHCKHCSSFFIIFFPHPKPLTEHNYVCGAFNFTQKVQTSD